MGHTTVHPQDRTVCRGVHGWRWGDWWWCRRWRVGAEAPVAAVVASGGRMRGRSGGKGEEAAGEGGDVEAVGGRGGGSGGVGVSGGARTAVG